MEILRTFEVNGQVLQLAAAGTEAAAKLAPALSAVTAPGAGKIELGPLQLSAEKIAPGETLTLTAQVKGRRIAFLYSEILLWDKALNQAYGPVAREYIPAAHNKVSRGVIRPDWDETIDLSLSLTPGLRLVTDGVDSSFAFLLPEGYGGAEYRLDGLYASADGTTQTRARITFDASGETKKMVALKEMRGRSAAHALTLQANDQFTPAAQILTPPAGENSAWQVKKGSSTPLTFRGQALRWVAGLPLPGDYRVGLLVQDLDGGLTRQYAPLTIGA